MKSTIVVCSHNRPIQRDTRLCLNELTSRGAAFIGQEGCSDVTLARNMALTGACEAFRKLDEHPEIKSGKRPPYDTVLMVDDDMVWSLAQAQEIVDYTRLTGECASAMYATAGGTLAASKRKTPSGERQRWLTGLGFLAIPRHRLLSLEAVSERFKLKNSEQVAFTSSSCRDGSWFSEDYELCIRLGGVHLLPMGVGHIKSMPLYPDEVTIQAIRDGRDLPETLSGAELDAIESQRVARNHEGGRG